VYYLLQLFLAVAAIYGALSFEGDTRLYVALGCLVAMFAVGRLSTRGFEKKVARRNYIRSQMEKMPGYESAVTKDQDFFTINSLLWPKGELILIDAVHAIFKDLGFRVATGGKYNSVDRIVKIPDTEECFGLEILMSEEEVAKNHPKIERALQFEKEKKENEKTLIIASTHLRQPISERERLVEISQDLTEFLAGCQITLITSYTLYQLWQKSKGGEIDILDVFRKLYSHPGGIFLSGETQPSPSVSLRA